MAGQHRANGGPSWSAITESVDHDPTLPVTDRIWSELESPRSGAYPHGRLPLATGYPLPDEVREQAARRSVEYREMGYDPAAELDLPRAAAWTPRPYHWTKDQLADWLYEQHPPTDPGSPCRCGELLCEYRTRVTFVTWTAP